MPAMTDKTTDREASQSAREPGGPGEQGEAPVEWERRLGGWLAVAEDVLYALVGLVMVVLAATILVSGVVKFVDDVGGDAVDASIALLSKALLALIVVELLYTVVVWLRDHTLRPDPFILVAITAAVRRFLLITAQEKLAGDVSATDYRLALLEASVLVVLVVSFSAMLIWLWKTRHPAEG
jgi:uncharacterized membrane protein (DUF373 family)